MATKGKTVFVNTGFENKSVKASLKMMSDNSVVHNRQEGIWRVIQELFEEGFTVSNPSGTKKITSKLLLQIIWKVVNKMKIPDFKIHKAGPFALSADKEQEKENAMKRDLTEQIVTDAVSTVMKEGKFLQCMRDKGGVFFKSALFGDCHVQIGYDEDNSSYPISFRVGSLSDVYISNNCTDIRDPVGGLSADRIVIIYRYTMDRFDELFPDWAGKVAPGEIPRSTRTKKQLEKTWIQSQYKDEDEIEVAYGIGIDKTKVVFAGRACTVIEDLKGKDFPYMLDEKPYIPLLHFKFFPSSEGYYNNGIGHMIYDLAVLTREMDNMAYSHAGDNVYPINFINSASKDASQVFNDIMKANEMRANGGKGYVVSQNPLGQGSGVTVESLQSEPITQEWERAFTRMEQQITRMGFRLDMPDLGANPNEMSIMAEQEATDAPIKQIIEWNTSTFEDAVNFTMDAIRKFVDDDDQTPLNSMVDIESLDTKIPMRGIPLGWVAKELRENKYFTIVNSRDGTIPSNIMEQTRIDRIMARLPPNSPAWNKTMIQFAKLNGKNITAEELIAQQAPAPQGDPGMGQPMTTETSPLNAATLKHPTLQR